MQAVARPMATRLLLGSLRRPIPSAPAGSASGAHPGGDLRHGLTGLLHRSPEVRDHHVLPRTGRSWFGGSHSTPKALPRRIAGALLRDVLASSFVYTSAALLSGDKSDVSKLNLPPTGPHDHGSSNKEKRQCTDALIAINLLVHAADVATKRKLTLWGAKDNVLIRTGQVWRLATSIFLHGGLVHITANSIALADFGPKVKEATGQTKFLVIYGTSALTGGLMSYFFGPRRSFGASGAICGLVGAHAVYTWRNKEFFKNAEEILTNLGCCALLNIGVGLYYRHRINNWSHLGGFLGVMAVEWLVGPHWTRRLAKDGTEVYEDRAPIVQLMNSTTATSCNRPSL